MKRTKTHKYKGNVFTVTVGTNIIGEALHEINISNSNDYKVTSFSVISLLRNKISEMILAAEQWVEYLNPENDVNNILDDLGFEPILPVKTKEISQDMWSLFIDFNLGKK